MHLPVKTNHPLGKSFLTANTKNSILTRTETTLMPTCALEISALFVLSYSSISWQDTSDRAKRYRPFAAGGHMVQNPKYWRAKECARLQNKTRLTRKVGFFFVSISQWSLVPFFCSPIFWILYHVTSSCKGPVCTQSGAGPISACTRPSSRR